MRREIERNFRAEKAKFIEAHLPQLEAIQDARKVTAYLHTEEDTNRFVQAAVDLKQQQKRLVDKELNLIEEASMNRKSGPHPVMPSK